MYTDSLDKYICENKQNKQRISMAFGDDPIINNINKLKSGRVDVIVTTPMVFYYNLKVLKLDQSLFKETKISTVDENLYVGFSPTNAKSATYILWLDEGIERLRKSGSLQLILDKYGIKDWI
jgi:polar amino acid transport system substrate-binding protein